MPTNRDDFTKDTKNRAASRVGFLCSKPDCRCSTIGPSAESNESVSNIGVAAHICAAAPGGKRYDPTMTADERKSIENCIWLCETDAHLIDTDEAKFTVYVLKQWKKDAEEYAARTIADGNFIRNYYAGNRENLSQLEDLFKSMIISGEFSLMDQILSQYTVSLSEKYDECILRNRIIWCVYCNRSRLVDEIEKYSQLLDKSGAVELLRVFLSFGMKNELKQFDAYCIEKGLGILVNLAINDKLDSRLVGDGVAPEPIEVTQPTKDAVDKYLLYLLCSRGAFGLLDEDGSKHDYESMEMYWSVLWEAYTIIASATIHAMGIDTVATQMKQLLKKIVVFDPQIQTLFWDMALCIVVENEKYFSEFYQLCPNEVRKESRIKRIELVHTVEHTPSDVNIDDLLTCCNLCGDYYPALQYCERLDSAQECTFLEEHQHLFRKDSRFLFRRLVVHKESFDGDPYTLLDKYKDDYPKDFLFSCMLVDFAKDTEEKENVLAAIQQHNSGATYFALFYYAKLLTRNSKWEELIALSKRRIPASLQHHIADSLVESKKSICLIRGVEMYEQLIASGYTAKNLHNNLGVAYHLQGRVEHAKREFIKEFGIYGSDDVLNRLLSIRIETSDIVDDVYLHTAEGKNDYHLQNLVAVCYFHLGNYESARKHFLRSLLIDERENPSFMGYWNCCRKLNKNDPTSIGADTAFTISDGVEELNFAVHYPQTLENIKPNPLAGFNHYSSVDPLVANFMYCSEGDQVEYNGKPYTVQRVEQIDTPLLKYAFSIIVKLPGSRCISGSPEEGVEQIIKILKKQKQDQQKLIDQYNSMQLRAPLSVLAKMFGRTRLVVWEFLSYENSEHIRNNAMIPEEQKAEKYILAFDSILTLSRLPVFDKLPDTIELLCPAQVKNQLMADIGDELEQLEDAESCGNMQYSDGGLRFTKYSPESRRARHTVITKLRTMVTGLPVADPVDFISNDENIREFVSAQELQCEKGALALAQTVENGTLITDDQFLAGTAQLFGIRTAGITYLLTKFGLGCEDLFAASKELKELNFQNYLPLVLYKAILETINAEENAACAEDFGNWLIGEPENTSEQHKEIIIDLYRSVLQSGEESLNPDGFLGKLAIGFYESLHPGFLESIARKTLEELGFVIEEGDDNPEE